MQILLYLWYFLRSATLRGLFNTVALLRDEIRFEKEYGIQSAKVKRSNSTVHYHYQGASYRVLSRIFDYLDQHFNGYSFCDIGCGKGRVLFVAALRGYRDLCGIELHEDLIKQAEENLLLVKDKQLNVRLINNDATSAEYRDVKTIYFLFNPFNEVVLEKVVHKILSQHTSEVVFVYMNPIHRKVFDTNNALKPLKMISTRFYLEAAIYQRVNS